MIKNAKSLMDKSRNLAASCNITVNEVLQNYMFERILERLSVSKYAEKFTLKGGIFLYALFDGEYARATMDIDLLAQHIPNDAEEMKKVKRKKHQNR